MTRPAEADTGAAVRRAVVLALLLGGVLAGIFWFRRSAPPSDSVPTAAPSSSERSWEADTLASALERRPTPPAPVRRTLRDRAQRNDVRERIYRAYGVAPPAPPAPGATRSSAAPLGAEAGSLNPKYIQTRIREDFVPLAKECYEAALERDDSLRGKLVFSFVILGDPSVGGIVESAEAEPDSTLDEKELVYCLRESLLSLSFEPPAGGGSVTVKYPFRFNPGDDAG